MKVSVLKSALRSESRNDRSLGIQTYGESNDYPQRCEEIINISGTGSSCLGIYSKFINRQGFEDANFYKSKLNGKGQTTDYMLSRIANDYALYGGFAIHVNYNALYQIVEVQHVPFETVRFEKLNDNGNFNRLATHPDWGRRYQALRRFSKDDIKWFDFYNPDPHEIEKQVNAAESWEKWNGQIFYFSSKGEKTYPLTVYDAVLTDMST
ncbi:MAG: hypothetical protein LBP85_07235, partial [Prevotellaceae bacterium]|nr:hypothetical protein [Prevotellaceae bacterium]